ncbi:MAG: hypothetical protein V9E94_07405 [Microthrixaceae bacterium]
MPHHVVDVSGVQIVALGQRLEHGPTQVLGVQMGQSAPALLADAPRRPAGVDDQCFPHV